MLKSMVKSMVKSMLQSMLVLIQPGMMKPQKMLTSLVSCTLIFTTVMSRVSSAPSFHQQHGFLDLKAYRAYSIRLVGGSHPGEGNVELVKDGRGYRVCDDSWDLNDCRVVCRMLGYTDGGYPTSQTYFPDDMSVPILLDEVQCEGTETSLASCKIGTWNHDCTGQEFAGVVCRNNSLPETSGDTGITTCGNRPFDHKDVFNHTRVSRSASHIHPHGLPVSGEGYHSSKIIGGRVSTHGSVPWQARLSLVYSSNHVFHRCGGVVIGEHWVLTAAHCIGNARESQFRVVVGDHNVKKHDEGEQTFGVEKIIMHKRYNKKTKNNDIALLKVKPINGRGIQFNDFVQPACLPGPETEYIEGTTCIISGWGNMERSGSGSNVYPDVLMEADAPLIADDICEARLPSTTPARFDRRTMLCAGYMSGEMDTCSGDSGGPLVCHVEGSYTVLGLTSWGVGCGLPNLPGVYTRVREFLPWIYDHIQAYSDSEKQMEIPPRP
ncbi:neurotrypsin-like [Physella acuta]|uniref:neurotrypsin-like n=1 Tax=Physella acuta TaxID=109671 RepID=UPI0027DDD7DD|nr:neurotrypsin-like [Physella acuta]